MKLSYLITVHDEFFEFTKVAGLILESIIRRKKENPDAFDETEIVILDDFSTSEPLLETFEYYKQLPFVKVVQHHLNGNFGEHKQFGGEQCTGDYVFQLDADEYPTPALLENVRELITANPMVELFWVPRVNIVRGLTPEDVKKWGWSVYSLPEYPGVPLVNQGDHQGRIYKNEPSRVKWNGAVHERIIGSSVSATIPFDASFALIHDKTIDRQRSQNEFYSKNWKTA